MSIAVKTAILNTAEFYGRQLSENVLGMYAEDLADLDPAAVCAGYAQYRRNPANRTFPLPAQIRELVCPEEFVAPEVKAREVAARIVGAISQYGWNNAREAQVYIGPVGWGAVLRQGGWSHLCEQTSKFNELTLQAQLRDQLMGVFKHGSGAIEHAILQPGGSRKSELAPADFSKISGRTPDDKEPA